MSWLRLRRISAPQAHVVTLAEAKAWLRVDASDDDALIDDLIARAEAFIEGPRGIGGALMQQAWRLSLDEWPTEAIEIRFGGVITVDKVTYEDTGGTRQTWAASKYRVDLAGYPVRIVPVTGETWPAAALVPGAIEVDFTAGAQNASDVPPDLRQAVLMLVAHWYEHREAALEGALSQMPLGVQSILAEHRRLAA